MSFADALDMRHSRPLFREYPIRPIFSRGQKIKEEVIAKKGRGRAGLTFRRLPKSVLREPNSTGYVSEDLLEYEL